MRNYGKNKKIPNFIVKIYNMDGHTKDREIREFVSIALGVTEHDFRGCMEILTDGTILHDHTFPFLKVDHKYEENIVIAKRAAKLWSLANMHTSPTSFGDVAIVRISSRMYQHNRKRDEQQPSSYYNREDYNRNMRSMDESLNHEIQHQEIRPETNFDTNIDVLSYGVGKLCVVEYKVPLYQESRKVEANIRKLDSNGIEQPVSLNNSPILANSNLEITDTTENTGEDEILRQTNPISNNNTESSTNAEYNNTAEYTNYENNSTDNQSSPDLSPKTQENNVLAAGGQLNNNSESESPPLPSPVHGEQTIYNTGEVTVESDELVKSDKNL